MAGKLLDAAVRLKPALSVVKETILIVEDDLNILAIAREALARCGYKVLVESNGARALELSENYPEPIDLLFTDIVMPRMGGKELAAAMEKSRKDLKVLFTSGYTEEAIISDKALGEGSVFIQKPYGINSMTDKIRELLDA